VAKTRIECLVSCRICSATAPFIIGLLRGKWPIKIRHPMGLRHSGLMMSTWWITHHHGLLNYSSKVLYELLSVSTWWITHHHYTYWWWVLDELLIMSACWITNHEYMMNYWSWMFLESPIMSTSWIIHRKVLDELLIMSTCKMYLWWVLDELLIIIISCWITHIMSPSWTAQEWTNRTSISHERTSVHSLVLPGSLLSITEITEYTYFSLI